MIKVNIQTNNFWKKYISQDLTLWVCGYIYSHLPNDLIKSFKEIKKDQIQSCINSIDGHFSIIVQRNDLCFIAVDKIRSNPLFFINIGKNYFIDKDPQNLVNIKNFSKTINDNAILEFSMAGFTIGNKTLFKNLHTLKAGEVVIFNKGQYEYIQYHRYYDEITRDSFENSVKTLTTLTIKIFKKMISQIGNRQIIIPLSSGQDSRLVASVLKYLNVENVKCYTYGSPGNHEAKVAKLVAKELGYDWIFIPLKYKSEKKYYKSSEYDHFLKFSETFCSVPYIQSLSSIKYLKKLNWIDNDAVFINGGAGDFISGGHINSKINDSSSLKNINFRKENILDQIIEKHFSLWGYLKTKKNISIIKNNLSSEFAGSLIDFKDSKKDHLAFEYSGFIDRQSKYVINGQRIYEYYGYEWRLPLWDIEYIDFWLKIPSDHKFKQKLYKEVLEYNNFGNVWLNKSFDYKKTIAPKWVVPLRFVCKIPFSLFGKVGINAWKQFEINVFKYFLSIPHTWDMFNYFRIVKDIFKKPRNSVSWQVEDYLKSFKLNIK